MLLLHCDMRNGLGNLSSEKSALGNNQNVSGFLRGLRGDPLFVLALSIVVFLAFLVSFFPVEDSNDAWWHLKAGKLIWEGTLGWYSHDPFTWTARNKVWVNHEWLSEWTFYCLYRTIGLLGLIACKSGVVIATFLFVFFSCQGIGSEDSDPRSRLFAATLATCLAIPTSQFTVYLRPPIFTFLLVALFHHAILRQRGRAPRWATTWAGCGLMALWANLHGGAIVGCVVLFFIFVGSVLDRFFPGDSASGEPARWARSAGLIAASSLVNPYGYHLHLLTFEMMSRRWLTERIPELELPPFQLIWTIPLLLFPAIVGVIRKGSWGERLVFLFFFWQGLSHVRHLPLLAIWAAPYAAHTLSESGMHVGRAVVAGSFGIPILIALNRYFDVVPVALFWNPWVLSACFLGAFCSAAWFVLRKERGVFLVFLLVSSAAIGFVVAYPGDRPARFLRAVTGKAWSGTRYPDQLADFILEHGLSAPMVLNRENYSGYLIWKLAPERMRLFTCSRYDLQGALPCMELETLLWRVPDTWKDPVSATEVPSWEDLWDRKYQFDLVLIEKYSDRDEKTPFPLWVYLNSPESGFVNVASEDWPGQRFPDQEYALFVRKGENLDKLMGEIRHRIRFVEKR